MPTLTFYRGYPPEITADEDAVGKCQAPITITQQKLNKLFPWHFAVNESLEIVNVGPYLAQRMAKSPIGLPLKDVFKMQRPLEAKYNFDDFKLRRMFDLWTWRNSSVMQRQLRICLRSRNRPKRRQSEKAWCERPLWPKSRVMLHQASLVVLSLVDASPLCQLQVERVKGARLTLKMPFVKLAQIRFACMEKSCIWKTAIWSCLSEYHYCIAWNTWMLRQIIITWKSEPDSVKGVELTELPVHSHGREILFSSLFQNISARQANKVATELQALSNDRSAAEQQQLLTSNLLHSILPPVCDQLSCDCSQFLENRRRSR